jgi:GNAT superfamily N-acetyltransferase
VADIDIRDVKLDDTDTLRAVYPVLRAGELHGREDTPFWSEREFIAMHQTDLPDITRRLLVAYDGDRVVGSASVMLPALDNLDKIYVHIVVHPNERGRGVGTALELQVSRLADDERRPTVIGVAFVPSDRRDDHPYRTFAESRGYSLANIEIGRTLELPVAVDRLDQLSEEAAPFHRDYRVETLEGPIPDELAESFCHLFGLLAADAPTGDLDFEPEVFPVEALRIREQKAAEQGRTVYTSLAIDESGQVVAESMVSVSRDDPHNAMQWATVVRSDHRGHRLGLAIKVRNLRALQDAHPEVKRVWTQNAEINGHMVSINERLGFKPVEVVLEFQRKAVPTVAG